MQLNVQHCVANNVQHSAAKKLMIAEASDLQLRGFGPLYDDAIDVGFALVNPNTLNVTRWAMVEEIRDAENDIVEWKAIPCFESVRKNPVLEGYVLRILND